MIRLRCNFYYFEFQGKFKLSSCSTTALADTAAASSAAEHQSTLTSLCTLYHLIVSTGVYMHSYSIHVSVHSLHCLLVQDSSKNAEISLQSELKQNLLTVCIAQRRAQLAPFAQLCFKVQSSIRR